MTLQGRHDATSHVTYVTISFFCILGIETLDMSLMIVSSVDKILIDTKYPVQGAHSMSTVVIFVRNILLLKSIWKEREKYSFPSFSIYFFPHFSPWEKMGKHTFFHGQKWGWTPPPPPFIITMKLFNSKSTFHLL